MKSKANNPKAVDVQDAIERMRDLSGVQERIVEITRKGAEKEPEDTAALQALAGEVGIQVGFLFALSIVGGDAEQNRSFEKASKMGIADILLSTAKIHRQVMEALVAAKAAGVEL